MNERSECIRSVGETMSRWIEADALECDTEWSEYHDGFISYSQLEIDTAPSIDIVRCRDCKYFIDNLTEDDTDETYDSCRWDWSKKPTADDFCSYGERE